MYFLLPMPPRFITSTVDFTIFRRAVIIHMLVGHLSPYFVFFTLYFAFTAPRRRHGFYTDT